MIVWGRVSDPSRPSKTLGALLLAWGRPPSAVHAERTLGCFGVGNQVSLVRKKLWFGTYLRNTSNLPGTAKSFTFRHSEPL